MLSHSPELAINNGLPIRLLGASVIYPRELALKMRALDPFFFQGGDPESDTYMWFSFLDTPANNPRDDPDTYECQILVSWPWREGYRDMSNRLDVPSTNQSRVKLMKELVSGWANPFYECVMNIPPDAEIKAITLEDFVPRPSLWDNRGGRVTLMGDAAHAMTMCMNPRLRSYCEMLMCMLTIDFKSEEKHVTMASPISLYYYPKSCPPFHLLHLPLPLQSYPCRH